MITLIHNLDLFDASLIVSALSCGLVTGFILTYAIVVMPGLAKLTDKNFLRAFQVTDEIIQNNQPLFMLIWIGSIISVITTIFTSIVYVGFPDASLTLLVCFIYLVGVQGVTIIIHIPLNNHVQKHWMTKRPIKSAQCLKPDGINLTTVAHSIGFFGLIFFFLLSDFQTLFTVDTFARLLYDLNLKVSFCHFTFFLVFLGKGRYHHYSFPLNNHVQKLKVHKCG